MVCNTSELFDTISDFFQTKLLRITNTIALMLTTAGSVMFGQHHVHTGPILTVLAQFQMMRYYSSLKKCLQIRHHVIFCRSPY